MTFYKKILNDKGVSLVNVMMAAAMLGGLALVMAKLGQNQSKMQRKAIEDQGLNSFVNNLEKHLINNKACANTFTSVTGLNATGDSANIDEIKNLNDTVVYNTSDKAPSPQLSITNMTVTRTGTNSVELAIEINKKTKGKSVGAKNFTKRFKLDALISGGAITKCYSQLDGAVQSACAALGGTISGASCVNTYLQRQACDFESQIISITGGTTKSCSPNITNRLLYNKEHAASHCSAIGGRVTSIGSEYLCRVNGGSCPTGWKRLHNWGSTQGKIYTAKRSCLADRCSRKCSTGSHGWQNKALEHCSTKTKCCLGSNRNGGNAIQSTVGCY